MGVLAGLASIILSITLYAYNQDQKNLDYKITTETNERKAADVEIINNAEKLIIEHERTDAARYSAIKENLDKQYKMIEFLYQREMNKK